MLLLFSEGFVWVFLEFFSGFPGLVQGMLGFSWWFWEL